MYDGTFHMGNTPEALYENSLYHLNFLNTYPYSLKYKIYTRHKALPTHQNRTMPNCLHPFLSMNLMTRLKKVHISIIGA